MRSWPAGVPTTKVTATAPSNRPYIVSLSSCVVLHAQGGGGGEPGGLNNAMAIRARNEPKTKAVTGIPVGDVGQGDRCARPKG